MKTQDSNRATVTVIKGTSNWIHFCSGPLQDNFGRDFDHWIPIEGGLFQTIERIMQREGIAHNVANVEEMPNGIDVQVTYNKHTNPTYCTACNKRGGNGFELVPDPNKPVTQWARTDCGVCSW